jgi:hypothetical protein
MNWIWSSSLVQWVVIFVLGLLLLILMRQAGEFANGLEAVRQPDDDANAANPEKPVKPRKPDWEPFSRFPDCSVPLLGGGNLRLGLEQKVASLVVFFTPASSECRLSPESIKEFFRNSLPADFGFLAVVDMERTSAEKYVTAKSLESVPMATLRDIPENIKPEGVLFAVGITQDGTIAARGRPRSVTHLIEMAYAVKQMAEMCPAHSRQQHDWGESAPYWSPRQVAGRSHSPEKPQGAKASVS